MQPERLEPKPEIKDPNTDFKFQRRPEINEPNVEFKPLQKQGINEPNVEFKPLQKQEIKEPKHDKIRQDLFATVYQAKAVLGTVNSEMKPDEIRKFKFVYQNSGNCPWPSDVKLIRVSGD